jgi:hypothetical protein
MDYSEEVVNFDNNIKNLDLKLEPIDINITF